MLSDQDQELIGIGVSIAAGCQPCTNFHLRATRTAGANDAEISRALSCALSVTDLETHIRAARELGATDGQAVRKGQ